MNPWKTFLMITAFVSCAGLNGMGSFQKAIESGKAVKQARFNEELINDVVDKANVGVLIGNLIMRPTDEQVFSARGQICSVLLWEKIGRKILLERLPKDILKYLFLLDERLCRNLAIILLKNLDQGSKIEATSPLVFTQVLFCAAQMILAQNKALLDDVYKMLPLDYEYYELRTVCAPLDREKNLSGYVIAALSKNIKRNNQKFVASEYIT